MILRHEVILSTLSYEKKKIIIFYEKNLNAKLVLNGKTRKSLTFVKTSREDFFEKNFGRFVSKIFYTSSFYLVSYS